LDISAIPPALSVIELVSAPDRRADGKHGQRRRLHRHAEARDHVRGVTRGGGRCNLLHRAEVRARVVLGDHDHGCRESQADQCRVVEIDRAFTHERHGDGVEGDRRQHARDHHALVQRRHDLAGLGADEERADDRRDDRHRAERDGIKHCVLAERCGRQAAEQHRGDQRHGIGFEQVGGHAGAVADVVADVVRDDGRVARVVLGNAGFDLTDEVGADVRTLREDAAAESREDRNQRAAEGEAHERLENLFTRRAHGFQDQVVPGDAEESQAHHEQAGDGAAAKCHFESGVQTVGRGLCGSHVGADRNEHADIAGQAREHGADQKADGGVPVQRKTEHYEQHDAGNGDRRVLAIHVRTGAFLDRAGDLLHAGIAGRLLQHPAHGDYSVDHGQCGRAQR
jgi:hypothetical protein